MIADIFLVLNGVFLSKEVKKLLGQPDCMQVKNMAQAFHFMLKPSCAIQIAQDGSHKTISVHYYLLSLWRPIEDFMIVYDNLRQFAINIFRLKRLPASL